MTKLGSRFVVFLGALSMLLAASPAAASAASQLQLSSLSAHTSGAIPVHVNPAVFDRPALNHLGTDQGIQVELKSQARARCTLLAKSKRARQAFPSLTLDGSGRGTWRWSSASSAPSGTWIFAANCYSPTGASARQVAKVLILTENSRTDKGQLVGHSTSAVASGTPEVKLPPRKSRGPHAAHRGAATASSSGNPYPPGQCTWYAWSRRPDLGGNFGNAGEWANAAIRAGFPVSSIPAVGTIAVFAPYQNGAYGYGHVAYVEQVLPGNRIKVSDYNWVVPLGYGEHIVSAAGLRFIYRRGQNPNPTPPPPPFNASLDAQFPMDAADQVYVTAGGPTVGVGFNVRFNQVFSVPDFVLRPNTPNSINRFSGITGDFPGAVAPNDNHVGYFRVGVGAPAGTAPGTYLMQWNAIRRSTAQFGGLQPSFKLVVKPPTTGAECPPPAPGGPFTLSTDPSFTATLDAQFPVDSQGNVYAGRGATVSFGFNVRFNQQFNASTFALRTDTPGTINFFSDHAGDWYGSVPPNDNHVGYYRANLVVPACTTPGRYFLRWNVINMATGKWAHLQPSFYVVVQ